MKMIEEVSAGGIVFKVEKDTKMWLVIHHERGDYWGFPKGHIGDKIANEQREDAALREVDEEGGVKAKIVSEEPVSIHYIYKQGKNLHKKVVYYFLMEYISGDPANHDHEVLEAKFLPTGKALEQLTYQNDIKAFKKVLKMQSTP